VCPDEEIGMEIQRMVCCGIPGVGLNPTYRDVHSWGRKAGMTDVAAALNLEALENKAKMRRRVEDDHCAMRDVLDIVLPPGMIHALVKDDWNCPYLFQVRADDVPTARAAFAKKGIPTGWNFPQAKWVTVPFMVSDGDQKKVAEAIKEICI
jgi:hypothetical protein